MWPRPRTGKLDRACGLAGSYAARAKGAVLVVGHQPMLGQTIAQLMGLQSSECAVRKGAVWWLRQRQRLDQSQTVLVAVQSPELL